jgi:hypothetical protein
MIHADGTSLEILSKVLIRNQTSQRGINLAFQAPRAVQMQSSDAAARLPVQQKEGAADHNLPSDCTARGSTVLSAPGLKLVSSVPSALHIKASGTLSTKCAVILKEEADSTP